MIKGETVLTGGAHPDTKLEIMESPAGFYLGFRDTKGMPYSRETEYIPNREWAELILQLIRS